MKRKPKAFIVLTAILLVFTFNMFRFWNVKASTTSYDIEWVNHRVEILYNGYILLNITIKINGIAQNGFLIGLPYKYWPYVLRCIAYDAGNPTQRYNVDTGVPLDNLIGFYGVNVTLNPQQEHTTFTTIFVLSNSLFRQNPQNTNLYTLDFPAFPSLTMDVPSCNASVILPTDAEYISGTGKVNATSYSVNKALPRFTYEPANITFQLTTDDIQLFTVEEFKREIKVGGIGAIEVSDSYYIKNVSYKSLNSVKVTLLPNASNWTVEDEFGRKSKITFDSIRGVYDVSLLLPVENGKSTRFTVKYNLPRNAELSFTFFQNMKYYMEKASITIALPEGAKIISILPTGTYDVSKDVYNEKISISRYGALFLDSFKMKVVYDYNPLWLAFRPTLWVWALAVLGCVIVAIWRRPKAPTVVVTPTIAVKLSPESLRKFLDLYEEKRKLTSEMKSLETAVRKGRIPRQRYKVQRKTLETRLSALSPGLNDLKLKLRSAGGRYSDLMRQLEVAETEIDEVESNITSIEARYRRGELTLEAYRKLLADYESRRDKAETTISGIMLRIREEIR